MKKTLKRPNYAEELLKIIQSPLKNEVLLDRLNDYHERDIADALELLSPQQRKKLYPVLGAERLAEIFPISKHRHSICLSSASIRLQRLYPSWILMTR